MQGHETERNLVWDGVYRVECLQCSKVFEASRCDATFCSARCRVAFSREPQKMRNAIDHMNGLQNMVDGYAKKYKRNQDVYEAMLALKKSLEFSLARFENE